MFSFSSALVRFECVMHIDYIVTRSLTTYRLWSHMLQFVFDKIKLYNVRAEQSTLNWAKFYRLFTERSPYFVNVVSRWFIRRLVVTTLYVLYSLVGCINIKKLKCHQKVYVSQTKKLLSNIYVQDLRKIIILRRPKEYKHYKVPRNINVR